MESDIDEQALPAEAEQACTVDTPVADGVAGLFTTPPQSVLQPPEEPRAPTLTLAPARCHQRWVFDIPSVRRSVRLSMAHPMTAMQRAQRNLCRKLGLLGDELDPMETALQEFLAMFIGVLP